MKRLDIGALLMAMERAKLWRMKSNVILVTIDCLRADHLSCYGYERKTTPFIDFFASKGMMFENAFANGPFTVASFPSILASAYPLEFHNLLPLSQDATLISEVLQKKGIRTAAIHSNPYLSAFYGYNRGWNYFQDFLYSTSNRILKRDYIKQSIVRHLPQRILKLCESKVLHKLKVFLGLEYSPYVDAETITRYAIAWLNRNKKHPFFLWVHYMDLHEPYWISDIKFEQRYSREVSRLSRVKILNNVLNRKWSSKSIRDVIDVYDDKLYYIDKCIKRLFHFLDSEGLIENTIIILTADHGQEFLDHGHFGHIARFYDELLHIPLIIFGSSIERQADRRLVSLLDIAPTILSFYDITMPDDYRGHNLISNPTNTFVISEAPHNEKGVYISGHRIFPSTIRTYAIRTENWKLICQEKHGKLYNLELYNLEKDPKETKNVLEKEKEKTEELRSIIEQHILWEKKMRSASKEKLQRRIRKLRTQFISTRSNRPSHTHTCSSKNHSVILLHRGLIIKVGFRSLRSPA